MPSTRWHAVHQMARSFATLSDLSDASAACRPPDVANGRAVNQVRANQPRGWEAARGSGAQGPRTRKQARGRQARQTVAPFGVSRRGAAGQPAGLAGQPADRQRQG